MSNKERKIYRVSPHQDGWSLKADDNERSSGVFDTQDEAVARGMELARSHELGQLVIQGRDGKIQDERTYGKDPFPPRG